MEFLFLALSPEPYLFNLEPIRFILLALFIWCKF